MDQNKPARGTDRGLPDDMRMVSVPWLSEQAPKAAPEAPRELKPWELARLCDMQEDLERADYLLHIAWVAICKITDPERPMTATERDLGGIKVCLEKAMSDIDDVTSVWDQIPTEAQFCRLSRLTVLPEERKA
jgi:hypothetical protein